MQPTFEHYSSDMVTVIEADGTIRYQSPALERILGYRPEEHVGRNVYEFLHPGDLARGGSALSEVLASPGVGPAFEFRWMHKEGGWRWLESVGNNLLHDPEVRAIVSSSRDVTARKGAETEARYRALVENLPAGILLEDEEGRVIDANPRFCEMFGVEAPPGTPVGRGSLEVGDPESFEARVEELVSAGEPVVGDELALADGRFFERDYTPVYVEGEPQGHVWIYRDVTARRSAERALAAERGLLRTIVDGAHDAIFVKDREHRFLLNNRRHLKALGLGSQEEALGKTNADLWGEKATPFLEADRRVMELGQTLADVEERIRTSPEEWRWYSTTKVPLRGPGGEIEGLVGISRDITQRRRAEQELKESEERYRAVVEQSVEGIFLLDPPTGRILQSNAALREMLGYSARELLGMTVYEVLAHDRREVEESLTEDLRRRRRLAGERRYRRRDGTLIEVEVGMVVVTYRGREALCSVARDLTERKRLERELRHQATHDPLTGLPNRRLFMERLAGALERRTEAARAAVLFLDLDGFKAVNDRCGHDAGDRLLVAISGRLLRNARPGDTVCRLGGDEFLILLEGTTPERAEKAARRLLRELASPFELDVSGEEVGLTASAGLALSGLAEEGAEGARDEPAKDLVRRADDAMYRARQEGAGGLGVA